MRTDQIRRTVVAAGLAIVAGGGLGAGTASAGGDTAAPKPVMECGTTGINGEAAKTIPCSGVPAGGATFTVDADGTVRDSAGKPVGKIAMPASTGAAASPGKPGSPTQPLEVTIDGIVAPK